MLKIIRTALIVLFVLALLGAGGLYYYNYTHEDLTPPVFTMDTKYIEVSVGASREELCQGLTAYDNVDGDITSRIKIRSTSKLISEDEVKVLYIVFDNASNYAICERTVRYTDYTPPRFFLSKPLTYNVGETIAFLDRISAYDVKDGNITGRMTLEQSTIVSNVPGYYTAEFSVSNRLGDTATLPLTVAITTKSASIPIIELDEYLIYVNAGESLFLYGNLKSVTDSLSSEEASRINVLINARSLDLNTPGVYEVYYYYTGLSGETATVILTVVVE